MLVILSGVLMVLFRGNAWYALLPFVLLLPFFCERREKYRILMTGVVLLLLGKGALAGIQVVLGAGSAAGNGKVWCHDTVYGESGAHSRCSHAGGNQRIIEAVHPGGGLE